MSRIAIASSTLLCLLVACGNWQTRLRPRAAYDLKCDEGHVHLRLVSDRFAEASGCGQVATYNEFCGSAGCQWVREGSSN